MVKAGNIEAALDGVHESIVRDISAQAQND